MIVANVTNLSVCALTSFLTSMKLPKFFINVFSGQLMYKRVDDGLFCGCILRVMGTYQLCHVYHSEHRVSQSLLSPVFHWALQNDFKRGKDAIEKYGQ